MKTVYIAHPLKGEGPGATSRNFARITLIAEKIVACEPDICPLSPVHNFAYLPVWNEAADARARKFCEHLVTLADELRVFGDWESSEGCRMEVQIARERGIPIVYEDGSVEGGSPDGE